MLRCQLRHFYFKTSHTEKKKNLIIQHEESKIAKNGLPKHLNGAIINFKFDGATATAKVETHEVYAAQMTRQTRAVLCVQCSSN